VPRNAVWCHNPEDKSLSTHSCEQLRPWTVISYYSVLCLENVDEDYNVNLKVT